MPATVDGPATTGRGERRDRALAALADLARLRTRAVAASKRAYAPYSGFPVGAAGLAEDGRVVVGCNVENAAYGLGLCAECGVVSALHAGGHGRLLAVAVVDAQGRPCPPCGRCRQLLLEAGGPGCLVDQGPDRPPVTVGELLPDAFTSVPPRAAAVPETSDASPR